MVGNTHTHSLYVYVTVVVRVTVWALAIPTSCSGASILNTPIKETVNNEKKTKEIHSMWLYRQKEQINRSSDSPAKRPSSRSYMKFRFKERTRVCMTKQSLSRYGPAHH